MGHPAVAGHSMAPGMPHNAAQQAPGGMPHQFAGGHLGVATPGGQVNPALMGAMPPGNPNGHLLQHMSPQQQQMLQQQQFQQQFHHNSGTMAAMRQHQQALQQQQARQMMAQQMQHMGPGAGAMPMGMQFNQQLHQLRAQGRLPAQHPQTQALMAQQYAMHQQQQQAAQAQAQAQAAQQQQQQAAQAQQAQQQQAQQAQQAHAQQAQAQQQQAQHAQQQGPQPQQGQPGGQPNPMNAQNMQSMQQNQMGGGQNQMPGQGQGQQGQQGQQAQQQQAQAQAQPQPQPQQPGQQSHHTPQPSQAGTPAPTGAQTPAQTPGSTPAQPPNQPPQTQQPQQHQPQAQPQAQQQMGQPQMNPVAAAQQMALQNQMFQQRREAIRSSCMTKLMQFSEYLSGIPPQRTKDDLSYWNAFVARFFSQNGVFRHSLHITDSDETTDKQYEIAFPAIARYFHTNFNSGVKNMQLIMDKGTQDRALPGDCYCIENPRASLVYWFETGSHLVASGTLRAQFDAEQKIDLFEFVTTGHEEYISRKQVIDAAKPVHNWMKEWRTVNAETKGSPELSKKGKGRPLRSPQSHPPELLPDLPESAVNSKGVTDAVHQFLEIVEVMGQMNPLFGFCQATVGMGPYAALEQYVAQNINVPGMNGQPGPVNARTPSFGQFQMGASPNPAHMNLPGSPHIVAGSPAPGHMQSPAMQLQASQQGTSSSGPSANTSPQSNKRRRPSGVKAEDDGSSAPTPGAQVNGIQRKPATPRMTKRVKGNS
uniref:Uncharacterized protein n=1 Tax=Bionectria ochroleuca TaxID=29856 RepID=A0A8H7N1Q0_BIOOC